MKIPIYLNTKTFNIKNKCTISLVDDLKNQIFYILKNELSKEWETMISDDNSDTKDYENFLLKIQQNKNLRCAIDTDSENYKYFGLKLDNLFSENYIIDVLHLELNYKCNLQCKHCYNPKDMNKDAITFEQAKKIIDDAYISDVYGICLTGGECTINKDFLKIAEYVRQKRMRLSILTNAQKLYDDENLFNNVINIYPSLIKFSLYSMKSEVHDHITGVKGSLDKTLSVIKRLREKNVKIRINSPMLSYNIGDYKDISKFAQEIGAYFGADCNFIYNKDNNNLNAKCGFEDIEKFYCDNFNPDEMRPEFIKSPERICNAGTKVLSIRPDLNITPCVGFNYILGNYKTTSLKELQNTIFPKFREVYIKSNLKECFKYDYCKFCSYCSLQSTNECGFLKKTPILCENAKAYYNAVLHHQNKKQAGWVTEHEPTKIRNMS